MQKCLAVLLTFAMLFSFTACGSSEKVVFGRVKESEIEEASREVWGGKCRKRHGQ